MSSREELYGWKGFGQLMALFTFQGLLGILFDIELLQSDPAMWSPPVLLTLAGVAALVFWQWHLLVPTLVRFELVFMPKVERRLLLPLFAAMVGLAVAAACWSSSLSSIALRFIGADVLVLSLVSFAVAWFLCSLLRNELSTLGQLRRHFGRFAIGKSPADLGRIELYLQQRSVCATPGIPIRGIEFPGLTSRPWHEPSSFAWLKRLEAAFPVIKHEILAALAQPASGLKQYRYLGVSSAQWQSLMLFCEPEGFVPQNCAKLPETLALLRSLPISLGREAMVSVLQPRSVIPAHRDSGNLTLTCQLGIQIPRQGCAIRVGRERRAWTAGKCIVFDTTYEHEVRNDSDEARVVFLFDFLHPELTETERSFFEQWAKLEHGSTDPVPAALDAGA